MDDFSKINFCSWCRRGEADLTDVVEHWQRSSSWYLEGNYHLFQRERVLLLTNNYSDIFGATIFFGNY